MLPREVARGFPGGSIVKKLQNAGDPGSITESGRSPRGGNGNPLQYSCLVNSMDKGARQATQFMRCKELDMTEQVTDTHTHVAMGSKRVGHNLANEKQQNRGNNCTLRLMQKEIKEMLKQIILPNKQPS